jgi:hypothetical protein
MFVVTGLKIWDECADWEEAEHVWEERAKRAAEQVKLKNLHQLPKMEGITPAARKHLKWKSLSWMLSHDYEGSVWRGFWKHPVRYGWAFLRSLWQRHAYRREGDFFLYGVADLEAFEKMLMASDTVLVVGFSYCHKPMECPSGRFNPHCIHDVEHPVCQQCFIGKCLHTLPKDEAIPLIIPTVHYIGSHIFDIVHAYPGKQVIFMITACEMTLTMFGDLGNMVGIRGIGIRLDGRICNTMEAFALSERGIKPGLTVVLPAAQQRILEWIRCRRQRMTL